MSGTATPPAPVTLRPKLGLKIAGGVILLVALLYLYLPGIYAVETDDAYVAAHDVTVSAKIASYVQALNIDDNAPVTAGQTLLRLDPRDFANAVAQGQAGLQSALAALLNVQAQQQEQGTRIDQAEASLGGDQAALVFAQQELQRYATLVQQSAAPEQHLQQVEAGAVQAQADVTRAKAALAQARAEYVVLQAQAAQAQADIAHARAVLAQAQLNLSYTIITADVAGTIADKNVEEGDYVQPGQTLFSIVPNEPYIIANYKETQITDMRPGQAVEITADGFPGLHLRGHVQSLQRGTGAQFALLPPENATGNFVKIVQRVPVKITFDDPGQVPEFLAPGMSVETSVHVRRLPSWLAWL